MTITPAAPRVVPPGYSLIPSLLSLFAVTAAVLVLLDVRSPARSVLVFLFVMVVPGWALLDWQSVARGWLKAALTVAISVSLATAIATVQVYSHAWSPTATVLVLVMMTLAACTLSLRRRRRGRAVVTVTGGEP
jgi:uncharacterized membrane protein